MTPSTGPRTAAGLSGFYASCTLFGIAVTITAVTWIVFPAEHGLSTLGWVGLIVGALSAVATWYFLGVMRRER